MKFGLSWLVKRLGKAEYKVEGGKLVKAQVEKGDGWILRVKITGDFFIHPEEFLEELEEALAARAHGQ
jgi:lipoate-protein ligase A